MSKKVIECETIRTAKGMVLLVKMSTKEMYRIVFKEYPDVLNVKQVSEILDVSKKTVYKLINDGHLLYIKVGREFRIPKVSLMKYIRVIDAPVCI